jgi:hypothetical protein
MPSPGLSMSGTPKLTSVNSTCEALNPLSSCRMGAGSMLGAAGVSAAIAPASASACGEVGGGRSGGGEGGGGAAGDDDEAAVLSTMCGTR